MQKKNQTQPPKKTAKNQTKTVVQKIVQFKYKARKLTRKQKMF